MQQYYDQLIAKLPKFDNPEFYEVLDRCTEIEVVERTIVAVIRSALPLG